VKAKTRFAEDFVKHATRIVVPFNLEALPLNVSPVEMAKLQRNCDEELGPNQPAQVASGIWVTHDKQTVLAAYFGQRVIVNGRTTVRAPFPYLCFLLNLRSGTLFR
jgi:hypothetical protein